MFLETLALIFQTTTRYNNLDGYNTKYRNTLVSIFLDFTARRCSERSMAVRLLREMSRTLCSGLLDYDTWHSEGVGVSEDVVLYGVAEVWGRGG